MNRKQAIEAIHRNIEHSYKGVFPLRRIRHEWPTLVASKMHYRPIRKRLMERNRLAKRDARRRGVDPLLVALHLF